MISLLLSRFLRIFAKGFVSPAPVTDPSEPAASLAAPAAQGRAPSKNAASLQEIAAFLEKQKGAS